MDFENVVMKRRMIRHFTEDALRELLGIPVEVTPMGVIPIGHPAPDKRSPSLKRGRRQYRDVVHREAWANGA